MALIWNRVTWYSQLAAIVLALVIFVLGFVLGRYSVLSYGPFVRLVNYDGSPYTATSTQLGDPVTHDVTFACNDGKTIRALFHAHGVQVLLSDGRNLTVPQAVSASGARYATANDSFVFWNTGDTAFITEGATTTYQGCTIAQ